MKNFKPDTVRVVLLSHDTGLYGLYWYDSESNESQHITNCYGFENTIRVANGIAFEQVEFVQHPPKPLTDTSEYP